MSNTVVKELELPALPASAPDSKQRLGERLDLVEHVNVRLTVTLGSAEVSVGRLFDLASGDVVELDRDVDAPVDVRLGGKLVARGELLAAGDRFALRITEIASS